MNAIVVSSDITLNISKSEIGGENMNTINARDLHIQLGGKREFATWIKDRIQKYNFIEGEDFDKIVKPHNNNKTDYILTLDTAKEIAMVENNEAGRKIRKYLIEVEKKYRQNEAKSIEAPQITTIGQALQIIGYKLGKYNEMEKRLIETTQIMNEGTKMLKFLDQKVENLTLENNKLKALTTGKAQTQQQVLKLTYSMDEMAEEIGIPLNRLYRILKFHGYLKKGNKPRKNYDGKYFVENRVYYDKGSRLRTFVLPKGFDYIKGLFQSGKLA